MLPFIVLDIIEKTINKIATKIQCDSWKNHFKKI